MKNEVIRLAQQPWVLGGCSSMLLPKYQGWTRERSSGESQTSRA
jgi:hypothetical protein